MIDFLNINDNISDEQLAAYIEGNATPEESSMIEQALDGDSLLSETVDVVEDCLMLHNHSWDSYQGGYGNWESELLQFSDNNDLLSQAYIFDTEHELEKNIFQGDSFLSENNTMGTDDIVSLDSNPFDF